MIGVVTTLVIVLGLGAVSSVLSGLAAMLLPVHGWVSIAWLLPSLALTIASLALGTWFPLHWTAGALTAAWLAIVVATSQSFTSNAIPDAWAFSASGQLACLVLASAGSLIIINRNRQNAWPTT